eukprot:121655_1
MSSGVGNGHRLKKIPVLNNEEVEGELIRSSDVRSKVRDRKLDYKPKKKPESSISRTEKREVDEMIGSLRDENVKLKSQLRIARDHLRVSNATDPYPQTRVSRQHSQKFLLKQRKSSRTKNRTTSRSDANRAQVSRISTNLKRNVSKTDVFVGEKDRSGSQVFRSHTPPIVGWAAQTSAPAESRVPGMPAPSAPPDTGSPIRGASRLPSSMENQDLFNLRKDLREKKAKIAILVSQYEQMQASFRAEKEIQLRALSQCQSYKELLKEKQRENQQLSNKIQDMEMQADEVANLRVYIADLQATNKSLEARVYSLTQNALAGDQLEEHRLKSVVAEYSAKLDGMRAKLTGAEDIIEQLDEHLIIKTKKVDELQTDHDNMREERDKFEFQLSEANGEVTKTQEKLSIFSSDSGINLDDLEMALDIVRREQDDPSRVDFIEKNGKDHGRETTSSLKNEIASLEISIKEYIIDVQNKENMINIQKQLNTKQSRDIQDLNEQMKGLNLEIQKLRCLVKEGTKDEDATESIVSDVSLFSNLSVVSQSGDTNMFVLKVQSAELNYMFSKFRGISPITFIAVDVFDFETSYSGMFGGFSPRYEFTSQYSVHMDRFFLQYCRSSTISVELYLQTGNRDNENGVLLVASCKIPLADLLLSGNRTNSGNIELFPESDDTKSDCAGKMYFVVKLYRPLISEPAFSRQSSAKNSENINATSPSHSMSGRESPREVLKRTQSNPRTGDVSQDDPRPKSIPTISRSHSMKSTSRPHSIKSASQEQESKNISQPPSIVSKSSPQSNNNSPEQKSIKYTPRSPSIKSVCALQDIEETRSSTDASTMKTTEEK